MIVGQSNRGWNSYGSRPYGLQRLVPTKKVPLEIQKLEAISEGFRFTFTEAVIATDWPQTKAQSYTYLHTAKYGSPEVDPQPLQLNNWQLSEDGLSLTVKCANLRAGYVHEFELPEVTGKGGNALWHRLCAYTLNKIP
jgi:hypothetical protein